MRLCLQKPCPGLSTGSVLTMEASRLSLNPLPVSEPSLWGSHCKAAVIRTGALGQAGQAEYLEKRSQGSAEGRSPRLAVSSGPTQFNLYLSVPPALLSPLFFLKTASEWAK